LTASIGGRSPGLHSLSGPGSEPGLRTKHAKSAVLSSLRWICRAKGMPVGKQQCFISVLDAACGDMSWFPAVLEEAHAEAIFVDYSGVDVAGYVISLNNASTVLSARLRATTAAFHFEQMDLVARVPSRAYDLVVARHVFMHLRNEQVISFVRNLKQGGSRYLLATSGYNCHCNADIEAEGDFQPRELTSPPLSFPTSALSALFLDTDGPLTLWTLPHVTLPVSEAASGHTNRMRAGCSKPKPGLRGGKRAGVGRQLLGHRHILASGRHASHPQTSQLSLRDPSTMCTACCASQWVCNSTELLRCNRRLRSVRGSWGGAMPTHGS